MQHIKRSLKKSVFLETTNSNHGSYATRAARLKTLKNISEELKNKGFTKINNQNFKTKHIDALVQTWKEKNNSDLTIANKLAHVNWYCRMIDKDGIQRKPSDYNIYREKFDKNNPNARYPDKSSDFVKNGDLSGFSEREQLSLKLQREFGLRHCESLKIKPYKADKGDHLSLTGSWTKGKKPRTIPINNEQQRNLLEKCKEIAGKNGSMIDKSKSFIQASEKLNNAISKLNNELKNSDFTQHMSRHAYAQERYNQVTKELGFEMNATCKNGALQTAEKTSDQLKIDREARLIVSRELGHERTEITYKYMGR